MSYIFFRMKFQSELKGKSSKSALVSFKKDVESYKTQATFTNQKEISDIEDLIIDIDIEIERPSVKTRNNSPTGIITLNVNELRDLDHAIIDRGLKRRRGLARNVIADLIKGISHGQFGRELGNRKPCRLRGQGG